jgi:hypothetical protein
VTPENHKRVVKAARSIAAILGVVTMITPLILWVDDRYMHNDIANIRYIDLQINLIEKNLRDYQRLVDTRAIVTAADETNYQLDISSIRELQKQRNKMLGIKE